MSGYGRKFPPGTRVHVEFDGVVKDEKDLPSEPSSPWQLPVEQVNDDPNEGWIHFVNRNSALVTIVGDENWPPQKGDTWHLTDHSASIYHVIQNGYAGEDDGDGRLYFYTPNGGYKYPIRAEAPDGWTLTFRPDDSV